MHNGSHASEDATQEIIATGYDTRDVHIPAVLWNVAIIWGLVLCTMVLMVGLLHTLNAYKAKADAALEAASPIMAERGRVIPPFPHLQQNEQADMAKMRYTEDAVLNGAGWVERRDNAKGVVRIPIERAIDIVAEKAAKTKELPYWPAQPVAGTPAQPVAGAPAPVPAPAVVIPAPVPAPVSAPAPKAAG